MHKLTKLKAVDNPQAPTADTHDEYRESVVSGLFNYNDTALSPNVEYWVIGKINSEPEVGKCFSMDRYIRNGTEVRGMFSSTKITKITEDGFETMNSVYKLEKVSDEEFSSCIH